MTQPKAAQPAGIELLRAIQNQDDAFRRVVKRSPDDWGQWVGGTSAAATPYTLTVSNNATPTTSYVASTVLNG